MITKAKLILFLLFFVWYNSAIGSFLITPKSNIVINDTVIDFSWNNLGDNFIYNLEISNDINFLSTIISINTGSTDTTISGFRWDSLYYWRIIADNSIEKQYSDTFAFKITQIYNLPDINLWLTSSKGVVKSTDSSVLYWINQANISDTVFQETESKQPVFINKDSLINNQPSLFFNGSNTLIDLNYHKFGAMFVLARWGGDEETFPLYNGIIAKYETGDFPYIFIGNKTTSDIYDGGNPWGGNIYVNKIHTNEYNPIKEYKLLYGKTSNPANFDDIQIGSAIKNNIHNWNGYITEIIAFDTIPSDSIKDIVNNYLRQKYSPPINLGKDISLYGFPDTVISAYKPWFLSYSWNTNSTDSVITVSEAGTYSVIVTDIFGYESTDSVKVTYPVPNQIIDTTICLSDTIIWHTQLTGKYYYYWGSTNGLLPDSTYSYLRIVEPGEYWLTIKDTLGNSWFSDTITVMVDSFPVNNSLGADRSVCKGENITLIEQGDSIVSWLWNTGNTDSYITIDTAGEYSVIVTNFRSCKETDTVNLSISGEAPTVFFTADTVCFGDSTAFVNLTTIPYPDTIVNYTWDFGNQDTSYVVNPTYKYQSADTFIVTITATSSKGCSNFHQDSVVIKPIPSSGFYVKYGNAQCTGKEVQFVDTSISLFPIETYLWNFGNNNSSDIKNPVNTYNQSGIYTVVQKITSNIGCSDSSFSVIKINDNAILPEPTTLISPNNNYQITEVSTINFKWNNNKDAVYYYFQLSIDSLFNNILYGEKYIEDLELNFTITTEGNYYWRIIAYNVCNDSSISYYNTIKYNNISTLPNINLWLTASKGIINSTDSSVLYWINQANTCDTVFQETESKQPVFIDKDSLINNQPSLFFNGSSALIDLNYHKFGAMFVLARWGGDEETFPLYNGIIAKYETGDFPYIFIGNKTTSDIYAGGNPWGGNIYVNKIHTNEYNPIKEYKLLYGKTSNPANFDDIQIGSAIKNNIHNWNGYITEIIAFDTIPSDSIKDIINNYLRQKYSPPVNLGQNISLYGFPDTLISAHKPWFTSYLWNTGSTDSAITVSKAGQYSVTVTDIFGYQSSDSIKVTYPIPNQLSDTTICMFDTITWETKLQEKYYYYWRSTTSSVPDSTHPDMQISSQGKYWVEIKDTMGNSWYSDTLTVMVDSFPHTTTLGNDTALCKGNNLYLQNGGNEAVSYLWSTGSTNDYITLQEAGEYSVTVSNAKGCIAKDTITITALNGIAPIPKFSFENQCLGSNTIFTESSSSPDGSKITDWLWEFGDGDSFSGQNSSHIFPDTGIYITVLTVKTTNNCSNSVRKDIDIYSNPVADFSPLTTCSYSSTQMQNLSKSIDGDIVGNSWLFPDNSTDTTVNPKYIFTSSGQANVTLIVTSSFSCSDTITKQIEIKDGPDVNFIYTPPCDGSPIYFTDKTVSFLNSPLSYKWTFANGDISTQNNPEYTFPDTGIYTVTLEVNQRINNCINTSSQTVTVTPAPIAIIKADNLCEKSNVILTDLSRSPQSEIVKQTWLIDSIGTLSGNKVTVVFDTIGKYKASLTVKDNNGCLASITDTLIINHTPITAFESSVTKGAIPLYVEFNNQTSGADEFFWNFGDGYSSVDFAPNHTYTDSGNYNVQLLALNSFGCADSTSSSIKAVVPLVDLVVTDVYTEENNGYLKTTAVIQNRGTVDIDDVNIFFKANYGQTIRESLPIPLLSGETTIHTFATDFKLSNRIILSYVCIKALSASLPDDIPDNNESCKAFENTFKAMPPYPNPTKDKLVIEFIMPYSGTIDISLYNQFGKLVHNLYTGKANEGMNRLIFDIRPLSKGTYIYKIEFENSKKSFQIVVE